MENITLKELIENPKYYYDGDDLGVTYSKEASTFKVWAPTAQEIYLKLYEDAGEYNEFGRVENHSGGRAILMDKAESGLWTTTVEGDLADHYYMYKVEFASEVVNYAVDPYAKAVSANGQRGYILDLENTKPENWTPEIKPILESPTDAIIYELHVRDFSLDTNSGMENKGKFLAFTEEGTTNGAGDETGIDHLKDLGITHVQLLPFYDFYTINELQVDNPESDQAKFNWGYDPQNYNAPEGSYSSDPTDPYARIRELRAAIQNLHDNGMRVIMDVVYNHTYQTENSDFHKLVPYYYHRVDASGNFTNGSGTGNEIASEHPMARKFIVDSAKYWVEEYGIDGFRFDLMGLIDTDTMTEVVEELHAIDPSIIVLGEPWQAGGSPLPTKKQTLKGAQKGKNFAVFNDHFRNAIRGEGGNDSTKGFATGGEGEEAEVIEGVRGAYNDFTEKPEETINYVTAHDNLNLWDKVINTQGLNKQEGFVQMHEGQLVGKTAKKYSSIEEAVIVATPHIAVDKEDPLANETVKRSLLLNGIILTSQGIPFIHAGDEILRTKFGDYNSYRSPDAINTIRWKNKTTYKPVHEYYKGLIELRKNHPAFRMNDVALIKNKLVFTHGRDNVVSFVLKDNANGDSWKNIYVVYNANTEATIVNHIPHAGTWNVVVNDKQAGVEVIEQLEVGSDKQIEVAPLSLLVMYDVAEL